MLNPYEVLGVNKYDDDQTVKKAYRQLSKQYHPDNNINNPNKAAAEETFKKIQQAYEQAMHERSIGIGGPNDPGRYRQSTESTYSSGNTDYRETNSRSSNYQGNNSYQSNNQSSSYQGNSYQNNSYQNNNYQNNSYQSNSDQNNSYRNNNYQNSNQGGYYTNGGFNQYNSYNSGNNSGYGSAYSDSYYGRNGEKSRPEYGYKERPNNTFTGWDSRNFGGYYTGSPQNAQTKYQDRESALNAVASYINNRNFFGALEALEGISERNDVWYYYSAVANLALGNNITAMSCINIALNMNPGVPEYLELKRGMESGSLQYRGRADAFVPQKSNKGNICVKLILINVVLNIVCGGGGLCLSGPCTAC